MAKEEEGMLLLLRCGNLLEDWCEECVDCRVFSGIYDGDTKCSFSFGRVGIGTGLMAVLKKFVCSTITLTPN